MSVSLSVEPRVDHPTAIAEFNDFGFVPRNERSVDQLPTIAVIFTFKEMQSMVEVDQGV